MFLHRQRTNFFFSLIWSVLLYSSLSLIESGKSRQFAKQSCQQRMSCPLVERNSKKADICHVNPHCLFVACCMDTRDMEQLNQQVSCNGESSSVCQTRDHERQERNTNIPTSSALAVVPYDEKSLYPHERHSRSFHLAGRDFQIHQNWQNGGVAAVVWDAAVVLAEYLAENVHLVIGKKVLELGAGTGLTGIVAASLGANVTVTERAMAIPYLEDSISLNQGKNQWNITAEVLDWTDKLDTNMWKDFDIVLGADIVYIEDTFSDLLRTIKDVAPDTTTNVLLSCRIRYDRDLKFLDMLRQFYNVTEVLYNSKLDIKIFSAVRKPS